MWKAIGRLGVFAITLCCVLLNLVLPVCAAEAVPDAVLDAIESVIKVQDSEGITGSGFVIENENGELLIVTNNHVVENDRNGIFIWVTNEETAAADVVFAVAEKDLAVLRVREEIDIKPAILAKEDAQRGAAVYAVGFPSAGNDLSDSAARISDDAMITDGIVSAIRSMTNVEGGDPIKLLQMNAVISPGNSGGPLFNSDGKVVGINAFGSTRTESVNGAICVSELRALLEKYEIDIAPVAEETQPLPGTGPVEVPQKRSGVPVLWIAIVGAAAVTVVLCFRKKRKDSGRKASAESTEHKAPEPVPSNNNGLKPPGPLPAKENGLKPSEPIPSNNNGLKPPGPLPPTIESEENGHSKLKPIKWLEQE